MNAAANPNQSKEATMAQSLRSHPRAHEIHALAREIRRQASGLQTMAEAVAQARRELGIR